MDGSQLYVEQYRDHPEGSLFFQRQWSQRLDERRAQADEERQKRFDAWKLEQEAEEKMMASASGNNNSVPSPKSSDDEGMSSGSSVTSSASVSCVTSPMNVTDNSSSDEEGSHDHIITTAPATIITATSSMMFSPCFDHESSYSPSLSPTLAAALHPGNMLSPAFSSYSPDLTSSPFATAPIPFALPECLSPSASTDTCTTSDPAAPIYSISILQHITGEHGRVADDMPVFRRGKVSPPKKASSRTRTSVHAATATPTSATTATTSIVYQDVPISMTSPLVKPTSPPTTSTRLRYRVKAKRTVSTASNRIPSHDAHADDTHDAHKDATPHTRCIPEYKQSLEKKDVHADDATVFAFETMQILETLDATLEATA